ncbi:VOC family protein [bacterium]|jgi:catechol 2,3-dioxygenase-like lactoylglutathione lyase family enzyme|nr:VOC family protein [bacterium]
MQTDKSLAVNSFDHITLIVDDLEATRKFYVDFLGMKESPRPDFDFPGAWFQIGSVQIHVTCSSELAGQAGWGDRQVKSISRGHHFAFTVDNFDDAMNAIHSLGLKIGDGPKSRPDGAKQVYIYDPDGHLVEICSSGG